MGKSDTIRHRFDISLDSPTRIGSRTGEESAGATLGELLASGEDFEQALIERDEKAERIKFLKQFFAFLKSILTAEEYQFIKLRFSQKKKKDRQIAVWLGFESSTVAFRSIRDKLRANERIINRIAERCQWHDAQDFVDALTKGVKELANDEKLMRSSALKKTPFSAFMQASEIVAKRKDGTERRKINRRFYMRGFYNGVKLSKEIERNDMINRINRDYRNSFTELIATMDALKDTILIHTEKYEDLQTLKGAYEEIKYIRERLDYYIEKYKMFEDVTEFKEHLFTQITDGLRSEDLDENETYSERCAKKREVKENLTALPLPAPTIEQEQATLIN